MSQSDKIKLAVAAVVLVLAGILIYFNVRTPAPTNPGSVSAPSGDAAPPPDAPERPRGPARGHYPGK
jgi:hypothetical protein